MAADTSVLRGAEWAGALRTRLAASPVDTTAWMARHTRPLKRDDHSRVGLLELKNQPCFLKLYLAKSPLQRLGFRLGYGRGIRSFDAAIELSRRGLAVPEPRACLLVPEGMLLLTEGFGDARDLRALWLDRPCPEQVGQLMRAAAHTLGGLHRAGYAHGDCKWSNLLWNGGCFYLVDLEAVRAVRPDRAAEVPLSARQLRDLARFTVDAEELGAGQEQYDLFLESYCTRMNCVRGLLAAAMQTAAGRLRRRHRKQYGRVSTPLH